MSLHSSHSRGVRVAADEAVLAVSPHLTSRDRMLVRLVAEHRVLTTGQLCAVAFDSLVTARHRLVVLVDLGLLCRFRPHREVGSAPWHYLLGPVGAALLGAEDRDEKRWLGQVRADRQLALVRSQRLGHLTGTNWFFAALARHARTSGGDLRRWLGEGAAAGYMAGLTPYVTMVTELPRPDGLGAWAEEGSEVAFALEYDTEHLPQRTAKLAGYAGLAAVVRAGAAMPALLFCFHSPRREQSARRALAASPHAQTLAIATTALDPQVTSPAGPVWLPLGGGYERPVRLTGLATWCRAVHDRHPPRPGPARQLLPGDLDDRPELSDDLDDLDDLYAG